MTVPGSNMLNLALSVLGKQAFIYKAFTGRELNSIGAYEASYANPIRLLGSVQPVPRELFEMYGLEFQKDYLMFYMSKQMLDVTRDVSGSMLEFSGKTYQILSKTNWMAIDGWISVIAVLIPKPEC